MLLDDGRQIKSSVPKRADEDVSKLRRGYRTQGLLHAGVSRHPPERLMELQVTSRECPEVVSFRARLHPLPGPFEILQVLTVGPARFASQLHRKPFQFHPETVDLIDVLERVICHEGTLVGDPHDESLKLELLQRFADHVLRNLHLLAN